MTAVDLHRHSIGSRVEDLTTPALVVDLDTLQANIASLADQARGRVALRPHAKTHKCVEVARLQLEAGAIGITTATVWEAAALARGGVAEILIANEVVGPEGMALAAEVAGSCGLTVAIDDLRNARELSGAASAAGTQIGFLVDVEVGMRRCGVGSASAARSLAEAAARLPGLGFRGVMGYEGHCVREPDRQLRSEQALAAMGRLQEAVEVIEAGGLAVDVVSAGSTGTHDVTGSAPRVTELQAGSYVFLDAAYAPLVPEFGVALTVLATVISRRGTVVVLDCGTKTIAADLALPRIAGHDASPRYVAEEHAVFDVPADCALDYGDRVRVTTGHCCGTTNLHPVHHVVRDGLVVDIWAIVGRGPGRGT